MLPETRDFILKVKETEERDNRININNNINFYGTVVNHVYPNSPNSPTPNQTKSPPESPTKKRLTQGKRIKSGIGSGTKNIPVYDSIDLTSA